MYYDLTIVQLNRSKKSNGKIEQFGCYDNGSIVSAFTTTISFNISYTNQKYTIVATSERGTDSDLDACVSIGQKSANGCFMRASRWTSPNGTRYINWEAKGY